jgi:ethanolamine utilization protein EutA (predicted chaperonin)
VIFSRVQLRRLSEDLTSRYFVVQRETVYQSPVALTPYVSEERIDDQAIGAIVDAAYEAAGIHPDDVDTGAVILTGEALRRENAQPIAEVLAEVGGEFVCATAGHHMESMLAAYGSGAAKVSHDSAIPLLNIDIGGGTTKLAILQGGTVVQTAALHLGGRLAVVDDHGRLTRLDPQGQRLAKLAGCEWKLGQQVSEADLDRVASWMAEALIQALTRGGLLNKGGPEGPPLRVTRAQGGPEGPPLRMPRAASSTAVEADLQVRPEKATAVTGVEADLEVRPNDDVRRERASVAGVEADLQVRLEKATTVTGVEADLQVRLNDDVRLNDVATLWLTDPLRGGVEIKGAMFSGGVGEYVYGREERDFGDLGRRFGRAIRERLDAGRLPFPLLAAGECIRATALGASEYSVQLSGNTVYISSPRDLLPRKNLQVLRPRLKLADTVDASEVAAAIRDHFTSFDLTEGEAEVAIAFRWRGEPSYARLGPFARGIVDAVPRTLAAGKPLFIILDGDVAQTLGGILKEELKVASEVLVLDGISLWDFDYIDLGRVRMPSFTVPVTIKSLVFTADPRIPHKHHHSHGHPQAHEHHKS